jgi:hypothetical protein
MAAADGGRLRARVVSSGAMSRMAISVTLMVSVAMAACSAGDTEKQWYKATGEYTSAEFERDRRACTHNRQLDEACLRQRGWTSLSTDTGPAVKPALIPKPSRY